MNKDLYYQHSGKIGMGGVIGILLAVPVLTAVLGFIYGFAIWYIPFIYLNFFITIGFGFGSGFVAGMMGYWGKIRNKSFMLLMGLLTGLLAEYFGWVFWIYAASEQEVLTFAPGEIFYFLGQLTDTGVWSIFGATPTGGVLITIWIVEALIIIGAATIAAISPTADVPYCEDCDKWTDEVPVTGAIQSLDDNQALVNALEQGNTDLLKYLRPVPADQQKALQVHLSNCPNCENSWFLKIEEKTRKYNKKNEIEEDAEDLVLNLSIHAQIAHDLRDWAEKMKEGVFFGEELSLADEAPGQEDEKTAE